MNSSTNMGRTKGALGHCGIDDSSSSSTSITQDWRNGAKEKPVVGYNTCNRPREMGHCNQLEERLNIFGDLCNFKIPTRERSKVVYEKMLDVKKFQNQLLDLLKYENDVRGGNESSPTEEVLLDNNLNNLMPGNEIGLGCTLLKHHDY